MKISSEPEAVRKLWQSFLEALDNDPSEHFYESMSFGDTESVANELAALVMAGKKRGTASLQWMYEYERQSLPIAGNLSVVTDWNGTPLCIIETTHAEIVAFQEVTAEFALVEGEGDGSLDFWRKTHWTFFTKECALIGRTPTPAMPIVCEQFDLVYKSELNAT